MRRIHYNSKVVLTFSFLSLCVLLLNYATGGLSNQLFFSVYRSPVTDPLAYIRVVGHVFGHFNEQHYINNFLLILLIGPMLEEKYGSKKLLIMMLVTALVTGILHIILSSNIMLLGASGIVYMMIILSSYVNLEKGRIPLTLILVIIFYIGGEIASGMFANDNISYLTHVVGGVCGAVLGFVLNKSKIV